MFSKAEVSQFDYYGAAGSSANIRILSFTRMGKPVFIGIFII
jgi:hypothetical protein